MPEGPSAAERVPTSRAHETQREIRRKSFSHKAGQLWRIPVRRCRLHDTHLFDRARLKQPDPVDFTDRGGIHASERASVADHASAWVLRSAKETRVDTAALGHKPIGKG